MLKNLCKKEVGQVKNDNSFNEKKDAGLTYVNGIGFVGQVQIQVSSIIRGNSNIMCLGTMLYFLLSKALILPATYLVYFLGGDITINFYTGLIVAGAFSKATILFLSQLGGLFLSGLVCFLPNRRLILSAKIFKKPYRGVTSLAAPITVAVGLMGTVLGLVFTAIFGKIGIVFTNTVIPIMSFEPIVIYGLIFTIIFAAFQEILFRGIILTPLRRFGDGFAVIATSILFAVWAGGAGEFVAYFFISLPLCYFTIRSGSVFTAVISRVCYKIVIFLLSLSAGTLERSLAEVILLLSIIIISLFAAYCFIIFIKSDANAFALKPPSDTTKLPVKLCVFCSSIIFIFFAAYQAISIITSAQFIG